MSIKTILFILLILFFIPILLGKVDFSQVSRLIQNPASLADFNAVKLALLDLLNAVVNYYKYLIIGWLQGINVPSR